MTQILIEVRGGLIQNITSTSKNVEIYVKDYDIMQENEEPIEEVGWVYWQSKGGDRILDKERFSEAIADANK